MASKSTTDGTEHGAGIGSIHDFSEGDRVEHEAWGKATVIKEWEVGVRLEFDNTIKQSGEDTGISELMLTGPRVDELRSLDAGTDRGDDDGE